MRIIRIADGHGTVRIAHRRADVRLNGHFLGRLIKSGGRWVSPTGDTYDAPATAAEDLVDLQAA